VNDIPAPIFDSRTVLTAAGDERELRAGINRQQVELLIPMCCERYVRAAVENGLANGKQATTANSAQPASASPRRPLRFPHLLSPLLAPPVVPAPVHSPGGTSVTQHGTSSPV
jgi:hypothetical protein